MAHSDRSLRAVSRGAADSVTGPNAEAEEAAKLEALRTAVDTGLSALETGAYKEFAGAGSLERYLNQIADDAGETRRRPR